jgi:hypothetical protein
LYHSLEVISPELVFLTWDLLVCSLQYPTIGSSFHVLQFLDPVSLSFKGSYLKSVILGIHCFDLLVTPTLLFLVTVHSLVLNSQ